MNDDSRKSKVEDQKQATDDAPHEKDHRATSSRRSFLRSVGVKTLYVTPVVMTLTASEAYAGPSASCLPSGTNGCAVDEDCCSGTCVIGVPNQCGPCKANGQPCASRRNCCSGNCDGGFCAAI